MRFVAASLLLLCLLLLPAGLRAEEAALKQEHIVSLAPNLTEMIYALGCGEQVVGVTQYCKFPPEAAEKTKVGGYHDTSFESILALSPTLIFYMTGEQALATRLSAAGIETILVQSETIDDIRAGIGRIADRLGRKERGQELVAQMDSELANVASLYSGMSKPRVLWIVGHPPGELRDLYAAGPDTFLDEMLRSVNARNFLEGTAIRYPVIAREALMADPPDIVIETRADATPWTDEEKARLGELWDEFIGPAGRGRTRLVYLSDPHMTIPGPGVGQAAGRLARLIHGEPPAHE